MKLVKLYEKSTYLYITLHERVPNARNLDQCREVDGRLPAVAAHALRRRVVSIIILVCSGMKGC